MTVEEFLERLTQDKHHRHVLGPGLTAVQLRDWKNRNPGLKLPADFIRLLKHANGIRIRVTKDTPTGAIELLPLERIQFAPRHMYRGDTSFDAEFSPTLLAITDDPDSSHFVVLDVSRGEYLDFDPIDGDSADVVARDVESFLDWLAQYLED
jgi:hypothetical protein